MTNTIVSDAGPLITLEKMNDGFSFIKKLYEKIIIPAAVLREVSESGFSNPLEYLESYQIENLVEIKNVKRTINIPEIERLDEGEKEAISLAQQLNLPLLIEETLGRKIALSIGIKISGIAGQIIKAQRNQLISPQEAKYKLEEIYQAGRINRKIYTALLESLS